MTPPYTVPDLAARWQCSREFVYAKIRDGSLRVTRLGGKLIRITPEEVARWENGGANTKTESTASDSLTAAPLLSGETGPENIASASRLKRKSKADLNLIRSLENAR